MKKPAAAFAAIAIALLLAAFSGMGIPAEKLAVSSRITFRDVTRQAGIRFVHNDGAGRRALGR